MDRSLIETYAQGGEKLRQAVTGLSTKQLKSHPVAGTWSIQEIVIHLADSDLIGADRMKRIIAEKNPLITAYDETAFINRLFVDEQSVEDAVILFNLNRRQFARVLRKLPDAAFERTGIHTEVGKINLGMQIQKYVEHLDHHLKFLLEKKAML